MKNLEHHQADSEFAQISLLLDSDFNLIWPTHDNPPARCLSTTLVKRSPTNREFIDHHGKRSVAAPAIVVAYAAKLALKILSRIGRRSK